MARVKNMISNTTGRAIPNQFIITEYGQGSLGNFLHRETFQSYNSIIVIVTTWADETRIELDVDKWNYSKTTGRYRNQFLDETRKETEVKIKSGEYKLTKLNQ